jgi:uncharacterized protein YvpB
VFTQHGVSVIVHPGRPPVDIMMIVQIELCDPKQPDSAHVLVVTEYPDPYYVYDVMFDGTSIVRVRGRFW